MASWAVLPLRRTVNASTFWMALASHSRVDFFGLPLSSLSPVSNSSSRKPFIRPTIDEPVLGSSACLRFQITSSALNCRPLCHFTDRRTLRVHVLRSGLASHFSTRLWDANAIQKVDAFTVRLNGKTAQLAIPEQLFHYPMLIQDPAENGEFKVGSNGTGAFTLVESEVGRRQVLKARKDYWGGGPYLDEIQFIDLGDDPAAAVSALASKQVDGLYAADIVQLDALQKLPHVQMYQVTTAYTATARVQPVKPFDDKRVRQALRYAIDSNVILQISHKGLGQAGEHHHVSPVHPEYAKLPTFQRDVAKAKKLLAEAGYPNGIDTEIICRPQPGWELLAVQAMVEQWKDAGIRVKINVMPSTQYWEVWTKVPFGFTTWAHRPLGVMSLALAYRSGVPWNESKYSNPEFDRLLSLAEGTIDGAARRAGGTRSPSRKRLQRNGVRS